MSVEGLKSRIVDTAARSCVRPDLPVLSHTEAGSYPVQSKSYDNSGSVQGLGLQKKARRLACSIVTHEPD